MASKPLLIQQLPVLMHQAKMHRSKHRTRARQPLAATFCFVHTQQMAAPAIELSQ